MKKMRRNNLAVIACIMASFALAGCSSSVNVVQESAEADRSSYDPVAFSGEMVASKPEQKPSVNIEGCDTFTRIVDELEAGTA